MTVTTLKRTEKVNPLDQIKPVNKLDEIKGLKVEDSDIKQVLRNYEEMLVYDPDKVGILGGDPDEQFDKFRTLNNIILSPDKISTFAKITVCYENHENFRINTGLFISALIQNSYDSGNNNFYFKTNNIEWLGTYNKGNKENPLVISIEENHGTRIGEETEYSTFNIKENHGTEIGWDAKHSTFNIEENQGENIGWDAKHSTFKSSNEKTLDSIKAKPRRDNKFYLIKDGKEIPYKKILPKYGIGS